nr:integrase, catalytic region, zinc finger, CCHC-type, peptidase aspartic, catalytic [Tanacetum cinerariifolium]
MVNTRDKNNASTHAKRNKHVTFVEPLETSPNNTSTQVKQLNKLKTNVLVIPSTGVNSVTKASRSRPRSNTKIDRTLTAKSRHKKNVEDQLRNNKSDLQKKNRIDSGISFKHAVVNSNSNPHCKTCYGDYVIGDSMISRVYYVEGLGHNLFSIGQFCDFDLEVAFRKHPCFVRNLDGVDLIKGTRGTNLYTISVEDMMRKDLGKLQTKADIGFSVGYAPNRKGYRIYNKRTGQIMETIHITFDELTGQTASFHISSGPTPNLLTLRPISLRLVSSFATAIPYLPPTNKELEMLFQPMFDEYFDTPPVSQLVPPAFAVHDPVFQPAPPVPTDHVPVSPTSNPASFSIEEDAPSTSISSSSVQRSPSVHPGVVVDHTLAVSPFSPVDDVPFVNIFALDPSSEATSSEEVSPVDPNQSILPHEHLRK